MQEIIDYFVADIILIGRFLISDDSVVKEMVYFFLILVKCATAQADLHKTNQLTPSYRKIV